MCWPLVVGWSRQEHHHFHAGFEAVHLRAGSEVNTAKTMSTPTQALGHSSLVVSLTHSLKYSHTLDALASTWPRRPQRRPTSPRGPARCSRVGVTLAPDTIACSVAPWQTFASPSKSALLALCTQAGKHEWTNAEIVVNNTHTRDVELEMRS